MSTTVSEMQAAQGMQPLAQQSLGSMSAEEARAVAKVKAQFYVAKTYPRVVNERLQAIKNLCKIPEVALNSEFSFPRGRTTVRGPNIRVAELIASNWHNFEYGITEINRGAGQSLCEAYAIDMESNSAYRMQFVVPHRRDKNDSGGGEGTVDLKTDRDIYEMIANMGARRVREAIFRVIPTFVIDAAMEVCRATKIEADQKEPLKDRIVKVVGHFEKLGVTRAMLAGWLKCPIEEMIEQQYQDLKVIFNTIKYNEGRVDDYFDKPTGAPQATAAKGNDAPTAKGAPATAAKPEADGGKDQGSQQQQSGVAQPDAGANKQPDYRGGASAGSPEDGPPGADELEAMIAKAKTQDAIDEIQSMLSGNPKLNKTQAAALRGKLKVAMSKIALE